MATQVVRPIDVNKLKDNGPCGVKTSDGFTPIPDAKHNPHIIDLAGWAVDNTTSSTYKKSLKFKEVDFAAMKELPIGGGTMYYIILTADDGGSTGLYETMVWQHLWPPSKELVYFNKI
ncbi:hypothetical protein BUALT_Bualt02G0172100 [Buddleja alternifolia]|uniref:Cysteine proteinase inhibitor n=1 Tax=Buddleja alternifolia TaxID=168488 RepID=A0AAV6Y320_9LAMI|nr:hypothetical protein BUALT_Bualt02G0172100 [Buddleja alternifolia]